jgi:hypothetical protein
VQVIGFVDPMLLVLKRMKKNCTSLRKVLVNLNANSFMFFMIHFYVLMTNVAFHISLIVELGALTIPKEATES